MRKATIYLFLLVGSGEIAAQDSIKAKWINQEIGFNTVSLLRQIVSNTPASSLNQLPYDFFYNFYVKDLVGIRLGGGITSSYTKTYIEGQPYPRLNSDMKQMFRAGLNYNFTGHKRVTLNFFADYVFGETSLYSANISTIQTFPNPIQTLTTEAEDKTEITGGQVGVGVRYSFHKKLGIYIEVPYAVTKERLSSRLSVTESGETSSSYDFSVLYAQRIYLPTTIYLILRF
jgi:hypothetical protein